MLSLAKLISLVIEIRVAWDEFSGMGIFPFAMAMGANHGDLDAATYKQPAKEGAEPSSAPGRARECSIACKPKVTGD